MNNYIGQCLLKISENITVKLSSLFNNHISNVITVIKLISEPTIKMPDRHSSFSTIKLYPWYNFLNQQNICQNVFRRTPHQYLSTKVQFNSKRTFATSVNNNYKTNFFTRRNNFEHRTISVSSNNSFKTFAAKCDFPIIPIPTPSKIWPKLKSDIRPIPQNFMPIAPISDKRNQSEKSYRHVGNNRNSMLADVINSFPFVTQSDLQKAKEQIVTTQLDVVKPQENISNVFNEKLSPTSRNSFWSIADNFSFPSINKRFEIETFAAQVDDENEQNSTSDLFVSS